MGQEISKSHNLKVISQPSKEESLKQQLSYETKLWSNNYGQENKASFVSGKNSESKVKYLQAASWCRKQGNVLPPVIN